MGILILLTAACALFYWFKSSYLRSREKDREKQFIKWGLGVDYCYFYSRPFIVTDQCITINGVQEVVDYKSPICYSLVKTSWWGKKTIYSRCLIHGNYKESKGFQIKMADIPNGENYKIEVFSGFKISFGQFQVR
ncbi:hypothetical protein [Bacillus benzoevorans]|uniref:Uncharacterized protein n=1 Tax=Bacillus benzoevorans TaxID=1456 RepID=A0A7X0LWK4_9BACI|nr:hypothetical protein [Bacillus benzoevorans]MBB6445454.1 hypothetical protein [Bacillus benzoevorans]